MVLLLEFVEMVVKIEDLTLAGFYQQKSTPSGLWLVSR
jgi:hypothetical protein